MDGMAKYYLEVLRCELELGGGMASHEFFGRLGQKTANSPLLHMAGDDSHGREVRSCHREIWRCAFCSGTHVVWPMTEDRPPKAVRKGGSSVGKDCD